MCSELNTAIWKILIWFHSEAQSDINVNALIFVYYYSLLQAHVSVLLRENVWDARYGRGKSDLWIVLEI